MGEPDFEKIPEDLKALKNWVCWKYGKIIDGKPTKIPVNARNGEIAKTNVSSTWANGLTAYARYLHHNKGDGIQGIGFVVSEADPFVGIDLDHCINPETKEINSWGQDIINRLNSYSEISPSGTGVRIFVKGKIPGPGNKKNGFEIYEKGRFLTCTGHHIDGTPLTIEHRQVEIDEIHREIFGQKEKLEPTPVLIRLSLSLSDEEILSKGRQARNGSKFKELYAGNISGYPSQSEADLAFVNLVAFYSQDHNTLDRLFRSSGLMRDKWDRSAGQGKTYGQVTVEKALSGVRETYQGPEIKVEYDEPPKPEPEPLPTPSRGLEFPSEIMGGVAGSFARIYSSFLEVPEHFFFMSFLTCLGTILSERIRLNTELDTQPRFYTLLLGESADDRKSTAITKAVSFFKDVLPDFPVCFGVGSAEGLQKRMGEGDNPSGAKKLLLCFDEFKSFVSKCKIESSVLLPCINTLFESNRYESQTKKTDIRLENAHLSILAASTIQTYEQTWDSSFTDIGFNNRLFLVPGSGQKKFSIPERIPEGEKSRMKNGLNDVLRQVEDGPELCLTQEAKALYHTWYMDLDRSIHSKRLDTYAVRFMSIFAVNEGKKAIDEGVIQNVIALMDWQLKVRRLYDPIDADNVMAKLEEKIRRTLSTGPRNDRKLKQAVHAHRAGLGFYDMAKKNLERAKEIFFDIKNKEWNMANTKV
ncbi:MAG: hypothetical protein HY879_07195 [Deltaproteobacteria bacterium]|nr:hypothetical protein [Deltaproteobacteria bacterium]